MLRTIETASLVLAASLATAGGLTLLFLVSFNDVGMADPMPVAHEVTAMASISSALACLFWTPRICAFRSR